MSSDTTGGANKAKPVVTNPYAKRQPNDPPPSHASTSGPVALPRSASTFSQAFQSIEETTHYKQQHQQQQQQPMPKPAAMTNPRLEQERAEQRAVETHEATLAAADAHAATDRDHHVLLQPHVLYVSTKQRGNGVLKYIRNIPFSFTKMVPDYIMSTTACALFLSIKYHQLYPNYVHRRLGELRSDFKLRVLLVLVDVEDNNANALLYLNKLAVTHNLTLILAWTEREVARYLETFKALNGKDASSIQRREQTNFVDQVADFLTASKPVNKTDAGNLVGHFNTVQAVVAASKDELALCEGMGQVKVKKLHDALHKPFSTRASRERKKRRMLEAEQNQTQSATTNDDDNNNNNETKENSL